MITFKKSIYAVLIACLAVVSTSFGMENKQNIFVIKKNYLKKKKFNLFVEKHAPPKELSDLLKGYNGDLRCYGKYTQDIFKGKNASYVSKGEIFQNIERVSNAERIRSLIKQYNLDCLDVARKYICKVNNNFFVFAEYVEETKDKIKLTLKETQQLNKIAEKTGFSDWGGYYRNDDGFLYFTNIIRRENDKKLVFIDTERISFGGRHSYVIQNITEGSFPYANNDGMTKEAIDWVYRRFDFLSAFYGEYYDRKDRCVLIKDFIKIPGDKNGMPEDLEELHIDIEKIAKRAENERNDLLRDRCYHRYVVSKL